MQNSLTSSAQFASDVTDVLNRYRIQTRNRTIAKLLWDQVFNDDQRQKFGGDFPAAFRNIGTIGMWMQLRGIAGPQAVVEIATKTHLINEMTAQWLMRGIGVVPRANDEAIQLAIARGDLVLVEGDRQAFWDRKIIGIEWHKRKAPWKFLWKICTNAKRHRSVNYTDFPNGPKDVSPDYASKIKSTLVNLPEFPQNLAELIIPVGDGAQKLDLSPEKIQLFRDRD